MKKFRQIAFLLNFIILRPLSFWVPLTFVLSILYKTRRFFYPFLKGRYERASQIFDLCFQELSPVDKEKILDNALFQALIYPFIDMYLDRIVKQSSSIVSMEQTEYLKKAINSGHGFLLVFPHGLHNISLPVTGQFKTVHAVIGYFYEKIDWLTHYQNSIRTRIQQKIPQCRYIYLKKNAPVPFHIAKLLKENKIVAISIDGAYADKFYKLPFWGKMSILFTAGPFRLAATLKVPILPVFGGFNMKTSRIKVIYGSIIEGDNPEQLANEYIKQFLNILKNNPYCWTGWWRLQMFDKNVLKPYAV